MRRGPDGLNRGLLTVLSLLLLAAGVYGLARGYEAFGADAAEDPVLTDSARDWVARNENWFWAVVFVLAAVVAYLCLRWLVSQMRSPRLTEIDLTGDGSGGTTRLRAAGAAQALADDIESYFGVASASARLTEDGERPEVFVRVDVNDDADVPALRTRIEEHALPRFCQALEVPDVEAAITLRLVEPAGRVVR